MRRYAEGTTVTVDRSRGELTGLLTQYGCRKMAWGHDADKGDVLQFTLGVNSYRFDINRPTEAEMWALYPNARDIEAKMDGEWRRRWRAHVLLLKSKLEFVASGDTTLEREFMPNMLVDGGRTTLGDWMKEQGNQMLGTGE